MSNKKPNTSQIIKQAEILFSLLEAEADRINDDDALAEALAEEWGHEVPEGIGPTGKNFGPKERASLLTP